MLNLEPLYKKEIRNLGTYGFIKAARVYLTGAVREAPAAGKSIPVRSPPPACDI